MRCNSELLGKFGNFVHRVLVFAKQHCHGKVPKHGVLSDADVQFVVRMQELVETAAQHYQGFSLRKASQTLMELCQLGNTYFDGKKPWALAKDPALRAELDTTIALCLRCIQLLALVASPLVPETAQAIWHLLGYSTVLANGSWKTIVETAIPAGQPLGESKPLFRKIEDEEITAQITKLSALKAPEKQSMQQTDVVYEPLKETVQFTDFSKLDIRVVTVLEAVPVPKSKKLLKLTVDLGFEKRTVVSGIALHYTPEQLIGKKVLFLANLTPATLMGVESQGMVLAASLGQVLELPGVQTAVPGSRVS